MTTVISVRLKQILEDLTGQEAPLSTDLKSIAFPSEGLGYSQLNELLLLLGYDRINYAFFQFLIDGTLNYEPGNAIGSIEELEAGVERARKISLLFFGNVKFGFKKLARNVNELLLYHSATQRIDPESLRQRHRPIYPVEPISSDDTYYLGYIVQGQLNERLRLDPTNSDVLAEKAKLESIQAKGRKNQSAYLVSDHLDVYVATSMRLRHEYVEVAEFANKVFAQDELRDLNLRWFDPTQAYCTDRIDKGLAEALMLKRAKCTLYLAQESDTFGKDSELASTLAQGKPVIAYVPSPTEKEVAESVTRLSELYGIPEERIILDRIKALSPQLAWTNSEVRQWLEPQGVIDKALAMRLLIETTRAQYDERARRLTESHPLGVQVNLDTGVANGVLVVRSAAQCAKLIYAIVTRSLDFLIEKKTIGSVKYHFLREKISNSIFRVMTGDAMLTNSFWNFYLEPTD